MLLVRKGCLHIDVGMHWRCVVALVPVFCLARGTQVFRGVKRSQLANYAHPYFFKLKGVLVDHCCTLVTPRTCAGVK